MARPHAPRASWATTTRAERVVAPDDPEHPPEVGRATAAAARPSRAAARERTRTSTAESANETRRRGRAAGRSSRGTTRRGEARTTVTTRPTPMPRMPPPAWPAPIIRARSCGVSSLPIRSSQLTLATPSSTQNRTVEDEEHRERRAGGSGCEQPSRATGIRRKSTGRRSRAPAPRTSGGAARR